MNSFSKGFLSLFNLTLIGLLIFFSTPMNAQNGGVGSTGGPILDWEDDYVCWSIGGVDSTLHRFRLFQSGLNQPSDVETFYLDVNSDTVTVAGGNLKFQACTSVVITQDSFSYDLEDKPLCDYRPLDPNPYSPFIRWYLNKIDESTGVASTVFSYDTDYNGQPYTVTGQPSIGLCAELSDTLNIIDYEYEKICMTDSIDANTQIEYYRLWSFRDSVGSYVNVDIDLMPYTVLGKGKKCSGAKDFELLKLCDVTKRDVTWRIQATYQGDNRIVLTNLSSVAEILGVTNFTIDCGQGEILSDRQFSSCGCDYSNVPDGEYRLTTVMDFTNDGTAVDIIQVFHVRDGILYAEAGNDMSTPWEIKTVTYTDINFLTTPFLRKYFADGPSVDVDLDGNPYTLKGVAEDNCSNDFEFHQHYEPSTRVDNPIVLSGECWERNVSATGNDWQIADAKDLLGLDFNGTTVPLSYTYNTDSDEEETFVRDLQAYLVANNISFASVTVDDGDIEILGLDPSITAVTATGSVGAITTNPYAGDTTLLYSVYRYAGNGREAMSIGHFGEETTLPDDAVRVRCSAAESSNEEVCDIQANNPHVFNLTTGVHTYPANTLYSIDIRALGDGVTVKMGGDPVAPYPNGYGNWFAPPNCDLLGYDIVIDVTAVGAGVMVSYLDNN